MCDLIDLNRPDVRGALKLAKLASPLIPTPKSIECDDGTGLESVMKKCESDDNNPFDQVLHETVDTCDSIPRISCDIFVAKLKPSLT